MEQNGAQQSTGYMLAYPVYLDETMMTSFLAHLEGGVAKGESVTNSAKGAVERSRKMSASFRASAWVIDAEAGGERGKTQTTDESTEINFERSHTSASLFNILYEYLKDDGIVRVVDAVSDLDDVRPSDIVEVVGQYKGNGFDDTIDAAAAFIPYIKETAHVADTAADSADSSGEAPRSRSSKPARRRADNRQPGPNSNGPAEPAGEDTSQSTDGMKIASLLVEDARNSPVRDLVVETGSGLPVVLTVSSQFYGPHVREMLRDGEFHVVGKVTRKLDDGTEIRLSRRSVLGALSGQIAQDVIGGVLAAGVNGGRAEESVQGPSLQILPMAIFI